MGDCNEIISIMMMMVKIYSKVHADFEEKAALTTSGSPI